MLIRKERRVYREGEWTEYMYLLDELVQVKKYIDGVYHVYKYEHDELVSVQSYVA